MCALKKRGEDQKENISALEEERGGPGREHVCVGGRKEKTRKRACMHWRKKGEENMCALDKRREDQEEGNGCFLFFQTQRETWAARLYFLQLKNM